MLKINVRSTEEILDSMITRFRLSSGGIVTRLGHTSVIRGILYAFASAANFVQQFMIAKESKLFLSTCYGQDLDEFASTNYKLTRKGDSYSSCEVIVHGQANTVFPEGQIFRTKSGISYASTKQVTIPAQVGFARIPVVSKLAGSQFKVYRNQLIVCDNPPAGFKSCYNLVPAISGYDAESDEDFRRRLQSIPALLETETPAKMEAIIYAQCPEVARCSVVTSADGGIRAYIWPTAEAMPTSEADTTLVEAVRTAIASHCSLSVIPNITVSLYTLMTVDLDLSLKVTSEDTDSISIKVQDALIAFFDPRFITKRTFTPEKLTASLLEIPEISDLLNLSFYNSMRSLKMSELSMPTLSTLKISMLKPSGETSTGTFDFAVSNPLVRVECACNSAEVSRIIRETL